MSIRTTDETNVFQVCKNMNKTTDTIPEAIQLANNWGYYPAPGLNQLLREEVTQACLAYHQRKLAEAANHMDAMDELSCGINLLVKERDDLRTQRDYWDARCKDAESHFDEIRTRADKAEAEVAELQWDLGICSTCGGEIFHHIDEPFYDCQKCGQHGEATVIPKLQKARYEFITLKQDVRPLVRLFEKFFMSADDLRTLETFLAKHPECKSTNP